LGWGSGGITVEEDEEGERKHGEERESEEDRFSHGVAFQRHLLLLLELCSRIHMK